MAHKLQENDCLKCGKEVRRRQQAIQCDTCELWQHRTCDTGITQTDYRMAVKGELNLEWSCENCIRAATQHRRSPLRRFITDSPAHNNTTVVNDENDRNTEVEETMQFNLQLSIGLDSTHASEMDTDEAVVQLVDYSDSSNESDDEDERSYVIPVVHNESSIVEPELPMDIPVEEQPVVYSITQSASQRGSQVLSDNQGFSYTIKKKNKNTVSWRCTIRNKNVYCKATISQCGDTFTAGTHEHCHQPAAGADMAATVSSEINTKIKENPFESAGKIVSDILDIHFAGNEPGGAVPKKKYLVRTTNRRREKTRPKHPSDLEFILNEEHIPEGFIKKDIVVEGRRHIVLATDHMVSLLCRSKTWYMDATFKVMKAPFTQLFSIHSFIKKGEDVQQIPLVFVIMSGKRKQDYKAIYRGILSILPIDPVVKKIVFDFEAAMWLAANTVFPNVEKSGCVFHWTQAVWKKIQDVGLRAGYIKNTHIQKYCRQLMALPFIPHEKIPDMFTSLRERATDPKLQELCEYMNNTWITNDLWAPVNWSIFMQPIRTNNDVEGWHHRLNSSANRSQLNLYVLIQLLHNEAKSVPVQVRLLSENKLKREQRVQYRLIQAKLFTLWEQFNNRQKTVKHLLEGVAAIYGPKIN